MKNSDFLSDWLNRPLPAKLWHYTSTQGFLGIIKSKAIFATDSRFLNDHEETVHAYRVARELTQKISPKGRTKPLRQMRDVIDKAIVESELLDGEMIRFFVVSFSEAEDQLSQWRGYSHGSSGVSLAFDLSKIKEEFDGAILAPCAYAQNDKEVLMESALKNLVAEYKKFRRITEQLMGETPYEPRKSSIEKYSDRIIDKALQQSMPTFIHRGEESLKKIVQIAALLKNEEFREEREWRLIIPTNTPKQDWIDKVDFRANGTSLIPYMKADLCRGSGDRLPLVDVILGPGSDDNGRLGSQLFLETQGISLEPKSSKVPYKPW